MIFYKTNPQDDPYYGLWNSPEWLFPFRNKEKLVFPKILTVEPINICQNSCVYCSTNLMTRKTGIMTVKIMEKIVDEAAQFNASVRFGGFGEPLIHKDILKLVGLCKKRKVRTTIFTNGKLLNKEMMEAFCKLGLDEIRFSSSGLTPFDHNEIREKSDFEKDFKEKIIMACKVKNRFNASKPYFTIYTHVFNFDDEKYERQKEEYVADFLQYVDKIDIDLTNLSRVRRLDKAKKYYDMQTVNKAYKPCVTLYHKFIIHWNGDVFACDIPYNFDEAYFLGNLNEDTSLYDMYHSKKIENLRKMTQNYQHESLSLCKDCYSNTVKYENLKKKMVEGKYNEG